MSRPACHRPLHTAQVGVPVRMAKGLVGLMHPVVVMTTLTLRP